MEYKCIYCGYTTGTYSGKNAHLRYCKKRILNRYLKISGENKHYLIILKTNPNAKTYKSIKEFIEKYHDPRLVSGVLSYLKMSSDINAWVSVEIKKSQKLIRFRDGWIGLQRLQSYLEEPELSIILGNNVSGGVK
jgi:hypothetical protein